MTKIMSKESVRAILCQVIHPEVDHDLVELGMVADVAVEDSRVTVTLALPFMNVPIKDDLVEQVREVLSTADPEMQVEVELVEMGQQERAAFMNKTGGGSGLETPNEIAHVVAVLSGKGGVGKSSVAALLAVALRRRGMRVGVLDADITGPSIPRMFGLHQHPRTSPLGILPVETGTGIRAMSINLLLQDENQAVIWRGPLISNAIKQFWTEVAWGQLDVLVVDLPPGTSDASLTVMQSIPLSGVVLVTSPQDLAGMVVRKAAGMVQRLGAPIIGLVENMSYVTCPECGAEIQVFGPSQAMLTAAQLSIPLLGQLPLDPELACRCDAGEIEQYEAARFEPLVKPLLDRLRVVSPV
jgi:Mrp family chromosome partitioning ATPase